MRTYIEDMQTRPNHHKKRFALMVSGGFTLAIFAVWSLVMFGGSNTGTLAEGDLPAGEEEANEASPMRAFRTGAAAAFRAFSSRDLNQEEPNLEVVVPGSEE